MDFKLNEEQRMLEDTVDKLVRDTYAFEKRQPLLDSAEGFNHDVWQQLAELGLLGVPFSEEMGGFNGSGQELMVVAQGFGRGLVLEPYLATVVLAGTLIDQLGNDDQKASLIGQIIEGKQHMALAIDEPNSHYDPLRTSLRAEKSGEGYRLNGTKSVVLNGDSADQLIVIARTSGTPGDRDGLSAFIVDASAASITGYPTMDGMHAAEITFDQVNIGTDALLGEPGKAVDALEYTLQLGLIWLCAEAAGAMEVACAQTVEYTRERKQFGVPISVFQALQHRMVDMHIELEKVRSITMQAACSMGLPAPLRQKRTSAAKAQVGKSGQHVAQEAIQLFGGMGMVEETPISHYAKRIIMIDHWLGDRDYHLTQLEKLLDVDDSAA